MFNLSITLLILAPVIRSKFGCSSPSSFEEANFELRDTLGNQQFIEKGSKVPLNELIFSKATPINPNSSQDVRLFTLNNQRIVIEKIKGEKLSDLEIREFESMRRISETNPKGVSDRFAEFNPTPTKQIYACVEQDTYLYIFREKLDASLTKEGILKDYLSLSGQEKANIMLQVISKMQEIHKKGIILGSIKPKNIMIKGEGFSDLRIVDFSAAGKEGEKVRIKAPYYTAPEYNKEGAGLSFKGDIYSLGISFAAIELSIRKSPFKSLESDCYEPTEAVFEKCYRQYIGIARYAFREKNGMSLLEEIIAKAFNEDPAERYGSMAEFGDAIEAVKDKLSKEKPKNKSIKNFFNLLAQRAKTLHEEKKLKAKASITENQEFDDNEKEEEEADQDLRVIV